MKHRTLGSTDIQASAIGLGTWAMGGWMWGGNDDKNSIAAIHEALDQGVNLIDTAPAYGLGRAEELVGEAIEKRRDEVVLATKCGLAWHDTRGTHFFDEEGKPVYRYLGADSIKYELEQSLKRLRTDYIDLYITHWQDATTPVEETMSTLMELKRAGKIRAIGVSNVNEDELNDYLKYGTVDAIQERYSMLDREIESTLLPICRRNNISTLSYSSMSLGLLSGKMTPEREFEGDDQRKQDPRFSLGNRRKVADFFAGIEPLCSEYQATPAQLVIAWTLQQEGITYALCGARNPAQAAENARAGAIDISPDHLQRIDASIQQYLTDMD